MNSYYRDRFIKFKHSAVSNSSKTANNAVGATTSTTLRTIDYTPSDSNTIYVSKSGSNSNAGTSAAPVLTIEYANSLLTSSKTKIVIQDSGTYEENPFIGSVYLAGIYAAIGQAPTLKMDYDQAVKDQTSIGSDVSYGGIASQVLDNGNIILFRRIDDDDNIVYTVLDGDDYSVIVPETVLQSATDFIDPRCCLTSAGHIFLAFWDQVDIRYRIINKDTYSIIGSGTISSAYRQSPILKTNGDILLFYVNITGSDHYGYVIISGSTWAVTTGKTALGGDAYTSTVQASLNEDDNIVVFYNQGSSSQMYYRVFSQSFSTVVAHTSTTWWVQKIVRLPNKKNVLLYRLTSTSVTRLMWRIIDSSLNGFPDIDYYHDDSGATSLGYIDMSVGGNGNICITWNNNTQYGRYMIKRGFPYYIYLRGDFIIDGVQITSDYQRGVDYYFWRNGDFKAKHCTIKDILKYDNDNYISLVGQTDATGSDASQLQNCFVTNCDMQIVFNTLTQTVNQCIFHRLRMAPVEIRQADSGTYTINVTHNTWFDCYAGLYWNRAAGITLSNFKDNIFYECANYDFNSTIYAQLKYSIYTGTMAGNAAAESTCLKRNPFFINDGWIDPNDLDLDVQNKSLGDPVNSPAIGMASDGKNAGAYDTTYTYIAPTYTEMLIAKPSKIEWKYQAVNPIKNIMLDGSVMTSKDGQVKVLEMTWKGIKNDDYDKLLEMWVNNTGSIRVFLEPFTSPSAYDVMWPEWSNLNASPKDVYTLSRVGNQDVEVVLVQPYVG